MKNRFEIAYENSEIMAELRAIRERKSIEYHNDPIGFLKRVRASAQAFCDKHGMTLEVMD
jgi:hypothetical protein